MSLSVGIVGLPNVGKSTLFHALTRQQVAASNYPFCTIDPNVGVVPVPDERLERISEIVRPERLIPATVEFVDIAGLVRGASQGEGLGNQFLAHIRECDAVCEVLRAFEALRPEVRVEEKLSATAVQKLLVKLGLPTGLQNLCVSFSFLILTSLANSLSGSRMSPYTVTRCQPKRSHWRNILPMSPRISTSSQ